MIDPWDWHTDSLISLNINGIHGFSRKIHLSNWDHMKICKHIYGTDVYVYIYIYISNLSNIQPIHVPYTSKYCLRRYFPEPPQKNIPSKHRNHLSKWPRGPGELRDQCPSPRLRHLDRLETLAEELQAHQPCLLLLRVSELYMSNFEKNTWKPVFQYNPVMKSYPGHRDLYPKDPYP